MKKISILSLALVIIVSTIIVSGATGKTKSYYKGDAIGYNGKLIVGSTNMNGLEIFKLEKGKFERTAKIISSRWQFSGYDSFNDVVFNIEKGQLYAYAIDGTYFYKYNLEDLYNPKLILKVKDNSWDWFGSVERITGGRLATIGAKGVKIWNTDMQVIDSYNILKKKDYYNVVFSPAGDLIFDLDGKTLNIFNTISRQIDQSFDLAISDYHNRRIFNDVRDSSIYIVEDRALKQYDFSGKIKNSYLHISNLGYDVVDSIDGKSIYFTDGLGVVKVNKKTFKAVDWKFTNENGGWAMGLKVSSVGGKEFLTIFNNTNITILDEHLNKIANYATTDTDDKPEIKEEMFLHVDKNRAAGNSQISLRGGGFGAGEDLEINFAGTKTIIRADSNGRFLKILNVPKIKPGGYDIIVIGKTTEQHYNLGFYIE